MVKETPIIFECLKDEVILENTLIYATVFLVVVLLFEIIHLWRTNQYAALIWGQGARMPWTMYVYALIRVISLPLFLWGALILFAYFMRFEPKAESGNLRLNNEAQHHYVFMLDVSPSMLFPADAGPDKNVKRIKRAEEIYKSIINRIDRSHGLYSVIAFWNDAKVVVADTLDINILDNIFNDLPLAYAMKNSGAQTAITQALSVVSKLGRMWPDQSATLIVLSDGDVLPEKGLPNLPSAFGRVLILGIGDASKGILVGSHYSKQNYGSLTDFASRYSGVYVNVNEKFPETSLLKGSSKRKQSAERVDYSLRDYAVFACVFGAFIFACSTPFMTIFSTSWRRKIVKARRCI